MENTLNRNIKIYYALQFFGQLTFTSAVWTFFLTVFHNFSYSEAFIIYLISSIVTLFLEVPSGAWADRFGRKKLYILWSFCIFLDSFIWIFSEKFFTFIISGIILGIWFAIKSWNFSSLLHDSLEEYWKGKEFTKITANGHIALFMWRIPAALLAWYLYIIHPVYPAIVTAFFLFVVVIISLFIYEPKQEYSKKESNSLQIKAWLQTIISNPFTKFLVIILILQWALSNVFWFTYQPFFRSLWIQIEHIGILFAIIALLSALWSHLIKLAQKKISLYNILLLSIVAILITAALYSTFNIYLVWIGVGIISVQFWIIIPLANAYLVTHCPKDQKATILSIFSFWFTLWFAVFAMSSWFILDTIWIQKLYYINFILILILSIYVYIWWKPFRNISASH